MSDHVLIVEWETVVFVLGHGRYDLVHSIRYHSVIGGSGLIAQKCLAEILILLIHIIYRGDRIGSLVDEMEECRRQWSTMLQYGSALEPHIWQISEIGGSGKCACDV